MTVRGEGAVCVRDGGAFGLPVPTSLLRSEVGCSAEWAESNQGEDAVAGRVAEGGLMCRG